MKNVIVAWYNNGDFESHVPLKFVGNRNLQLGFKNDIVVLFLKGYKKLDSNYKSELLKLGFELIDANYVYEKICKKYFKLEQFGDYERNCFLRWLVIKECFPNEDLIHFDGDIVFNECPSKIKDLFAGFTFVLQGCPAFTCISNKIWFEVYEYELDLFHNNIDAYSSQAWLHRKGWEITKLANWAGERHRHIISSDQDLISHLIHSKKLPQAEPHEVLSIAQDYMLIQNPILIDEHQVGMPFKYERRNGIDYLNDKKVLFWHMQSDFCYYLATLKIAYGFFKKNRRFSFDANKTNKIRLYKYALISKFIPLRKRSYLYRIFFSYTDFKSVFNKNIWWREDVFA